MTGTLDLDILHCLAKEINCRATLAALCRVSKNCQRIFTPVLYERLLVQDRHFHELDHVANSDSWKPLQTTREFVFSRVSTEHEYGSSPMDASVALYKILKSVPNLESLSLAISLPGISQHWPWGAVWDAINVLATEGRLRNLEFIASRDLERFGIVMPDLTLPNLNKLVLHGVRRMTKQLVSRFVNMLLASPHLRILGLSGDGIEYDDDDGELFFQEMCRLYGSRREDKNGPLLQLEELELGNGFQLTESARSQFLQLPPPNGLAIETDNYLSRLTDLKYLRKVRLDNAAKRDELDDRPWLGHVDESDYCIRDDLDPYCNESLHFTHYNDSEILYLAVNLEHISFGYISFTLIELITCLRFGSMVPKLDSLQIGRYSSIQPPRLLWPEPQGPDERRPNSAAEALHMTGYHWRHFDFSDLSVDPNAVLEFIERCSVLESLTCGFSEAMLMRFKSSILPGMQHLHTLMITPYYQSRPFSRPVTRIPPELDIKLNTGKINSAGDVCYGELDPPDWKRFDWAKREKEEEEESQRAIASEIFDISWAAWENREGEDQGTRLKFVGLGYRVYTRMWRGFEKSRSGWTTVRLPHERAMEFNAVKTMSFSEDKWAVANRE